MSSDVCRHGALKRVRDMIRVMIRVRFTHTSRREREREKAKIYEYPLMYGKNGMWHMGKMGSPPDALDSPSSAPFPNRPASASRLRNCISPRIDLRLRRSADMSSPSPMARVATRQSPRSDLLDGVSRASCTARAETPRPRERIALMSCVDS